MNDNSISTTTSELHSGKTQKSQTISVKSQNSDHKIQESYYTYSSELRTRIKLTSRKCKSASTSKQFFKMGSRNNKIGSLKSTPIKMDLGTTNIISTKNEKNDLSMKGNGFLPKDKSTQMRSYFGYSSFFINLIGNYFDYSANFSFNKEGSSQDVMITIESSFFDQIVLIFFWFIFIRNLLLSYFDDLTIRLLLGETERERPARQLVTAMTIWSVYSAIVSTIYYISRKWNYMSWLIPFQVSQINTSSS